MERGHIWTCERVCSRSQSLNLSHSLFCRTHTASVRLCRSFRIGVRVLGTTHCCGVFKPMFFVILAQQATRHPAPTFWRGGKHLYSGHVQNWATLVTSRTQEQDGYFSLEANCPFRRHLRLQGRASSYHFNMPVLLHRVCVTFLNSVKLSHFGVLLLELNSPLLSCPSSSSSRDKLCSTQWRLCSTLLCGSHWSVETHALPWTRSHHVCRSSPAEEKHLDPPINIK